MKSFRMDRNTTEHYTSFQELGKAFGCRPVNKQTKDVKKLEKQREVFCGKHRCKACGQPMTWVEGTSTMVCSNDKCKGVKHTRTDADGNEIVTYLPSYDLLDELGTDIAYNIFS